MKVNKSNLHKSTTFWKDKNDCFTQVTDLRQNLYKEDILLYHFMIFYNLKSEFKLFNFSHNSLKTNLELSTMYYGPLQ